MNKFKSLRSAALKMYSECNLEGKSEKYKRELLRFAYREAEKLSRIKQPETELEIKIAEIDAKIDATKYLPRHMSQADAQAPLLAEKRRLLSEAA